MKNIPIHELNKDEYLVIENIESGKRIDFSEMHCHSFYEILYFTSVTAGDVHSIDNVEYPIYRDHIYTVKPFQVHKMELLHQKGYSFALTKEYFNELNLFPESYINHFILNDVPLDTKDFRSIKNILELIIFEHNNKQRKSVLNMYIKALLVLLILSSKEHSTYEYNADKRVFQLLELIEKKFIDERSTTFYAHQISLSEKRLNELTKKAFGMTVKQLISKRILLEAKKFINYGELTFKEIAFELGFNDSAYFSRFFKEQSGLSPEQFKSFLR